MQKSGCCLIGTIWICFFFFFFRCLSAALDQMTGQYSKCDSKWPNNINHCRGFSSLEISATKPQGYIKNKRRHFYISAIHRYVQMYICHHIISTFPQQASNHYHNTCMCWPSCRMVAEWQTGETAANTEITVRDGLSASESTTPLDIFDKTLGQFQAVFVVTEPGKPKHLFFSNPNRAWI